MIALTLWALLLIFAAPILVVTVHIFRRGVLAHDHTLDLLQLRRVGYLGLSVWLAWSWKAEAEVSLFEAERAEWCIDTAAAELDDFRDKLDALAAGYTAATGLHLATP